jgi:hypothetical protein
MTVGNEVYIGDKNNGKEVKVIIIIIIIGLLSSHPRPSSSSSVTCHFIL